MVHAHDFKTSDDNLQVPARAPGDRRGSSHARRALKFGARGHLILIMIGSDCKGASSTSAEHAVRQNFGLGANPRHGGKLVRLAAAACLRFIAPR